MHCGRATKATVSPARRSFCNTPGRSVLEVPLAHAVFSHLLEEVLAVELGVKGPVGDVLFVFFQKPRGVLALETIGQLFLYPAAVVARLEATGDRVRAS